MKPAGLPVADHPTGRSWADKQDDVITQLSDYILAHGGGMDIEVSRKVRIRPVEVDYLNTTFSSNHVAHFANSQRSFTCLAGINLMLGGK